MPVGEGNVPAEGSLNSAYAPILIQVGMTDDDGNPPPVGYCDIYINGTFYKTESRTQFKYPLAAANLYEFDLQSCAQEYLGKYLGKNGGGAIETAAPLIALFGCVLRSSSLDDDGFILPEGTPPVQATGDSPAVAGDGGTSTPTFYIVNAAIQQDDNQSLTDHLSAFAYGAWTLGTVYPLSHRPPSCQMNLTDSDFYPFLGSDGVDPCGGSIQLQYKLFGDTAFTAVSSGAASGSCDVTLVAGAVVISGSSASLTFSVIGSASQFQYQVDGGPTLTTTSTTINMTGLDAGDHSVVVQALCGCAVGDAITADFTIGTGCVEPAIVGALPNGVVSARYRVNLTVSGDGPFVISGISIPDWATIVLTGGTITINGFPSSADTYGFAFTITGACGSVGFAQDITVTEAISTALTVGYGVDTGICGSSHTVYINSIFTEIITGVTVYTNPALTTVLTGQSYVTSSAYEIFHINPSTGVVGGTTGIFC